MQLEGKVAFITGASRGIGEGIAVAMAKAGADVALNYFPHSDPAHTAEAEAVAAQVQAVGRQVLLLPGDVSDLGAMEAAVARAAAELGRLDYAIANAAYSDREFFYEANVEGFRRTIDVTMWGAFHVLRAASRHFIAAKQEGVIVLISSPHAFVPVPKSMAYNMSKAAIEHMARTAAIELAEFRIRVNTVQPGWTDTPGERKFASEEQLEKAATKLPWKRLATPEEIARGVVFMCDPASDYITGSALLIDGGITLPWWANRGSAAPE